MRASFLCPAVSQWHHEQGRNVWTKYQIRHERTNFCSSLLKSKPVWQRPEELKSEAKMYFFYINTDRIIQWSVQTKIFAHVLRFQANLRVHFGSPLIYSPSLGRGVMALTRDVRLPVGHHVTSYLIYVNSLQCNAAKLSTCCELMSM